MCIQIENYNLRIQNISCSWHFINFRYKIYLGQLTYSVSHLEKVVGLTGFVIIHVFIASFSPAQGERNQMVNAKFTRPVNAMPMSTPNEGR